MGKAKNIKRKFKQQLEKIDDEHFRYKVVEEIVEPRDNIKDVIKILFLDYIYLEQFITDYDSNIKKLIDAKTAELEKDHEEAKINIQNFDEIYDKETEQYLNDRKENKEKDRQQVQEYIDKFEIIKNNTLTLLQKKEQDKLEEYKIQYEQKKEKLKFYIKNINIIGKKMFDDARQEVLDDLNNSKNNNKAEPDKT